MTIWFKVLASSFHVLAFQTLSDLKIIQDIYSLKEKKFQRFYLANNVVQEIVRYNIKYTSTWSIHFRTLLTAETEAKIFTC